MELGAPRGLLPRWGCSWYLLTPRRAKRNSPGPGVFHHLCLDWLGGLFPPGAPARATSASPAPGGAPDGIHVLLQAAAEPRAILSVWRARRRFEAINFPPSPAVLPIG